MDFLVRSLGFLLFVPSIASLGWIDLLFCIPVELILTLWFVVQRIFPTIKHSGCCSYGSFVTIVLPVSHQVFPSIGALGNEHGSAFYIHAKGYIGSDP